MPATTRPNLDQLDRLADAASLTPAEKAVEFCRRVRPRDTPEQIAVELDISPRHVRRLLRSIELKKRKLRAGIAAGVTALEPQPFKFCKPTHATGQAVK